MIHTTLVCACALLVFSLSSFMPIRRFAWLMASLLFVALLGDLILLPAILVSPIGKTFWARNESSADQRGGSAVEETESTLQS
jgi:hypothetical protein